MTASRALVVTAAAAALVAALALSADASGGGWVRLGGHNDTSRTTTLDRHGAGPALRLSTRSTSPPFAVTSRQRVARLDADTVDGMHATQLRTQGYVYRIGGDDDAGPWVIKSFPGLPRGYYVATYRVVASFDSPPPHDLSCWFTTATQPKAGLGWGHQMETPMTIEGSAYVDGTAPFTFRINAAENYSIRADASNDRLDSRITFVRVAAIRNADTRYEP
jgi:hypothetical protein